jgi:hypothetical protein
MNLELSKPLQTNGRLSRRITPRNLVVWVSVVLILGGMLLIFQKWFFALYQAGFICLMAGAYLQIILGNISPSVTYKQVLKTLVLGSGIFLFIVGLAIWIAPKLTALL